jgi:hypothetical protein
MIRSGHVDVEVKLKWFETYKLGRLLKYTSLLFVREYVPVHCVVVCAFRLTAQALAKACPWNLESSEGVRPCGNRRVGGTLGRGEGGGARFRYHTLSSTFCKIRDNRPLKTLLLFFCLTTTHVRYESSFNLRHWLRFVSYVFFFIFFYRVDHRRLPHNFSGRVCGLV